MKRSSFAQERTWLGWLTAIALIYHAYFVVKAWRQPVLLYGDAYYYDHSARVLNALHLYAYWSWGPAAQVTPGYPVFLALVYRLAAVFTPSHETAMHLAQACQHLLAVASTVLVYLIARFRLPRYASFVAAFLWTVYPPVIYANDQLLTENLYIPFLLAFVWSFLVLVRDRSTGSFVVSGLLLGVTTLIRPSVAPLLAAPALFFLQRETRRAWKTTAARYAAYVATFCLAMLPWWIRNLVAFHQWITTDLDAANPLLFGSDPTFYKDTSISNGLSYAQQKALAIHRIEEGFRTHPLGYLKWYTLDKLGWLFGTPWYNSTLPPHAGLLTRMTFAYAHLHLVWVLVGALGLAFGFGMRYIRWLSWLTVFLIAVQLPFIPINRYAYPTMPFLMIGVGTVVYLATAWVRTRRGTPRRAAAP
ncbi:glycosyltransferase family 39 protein [Alicyclobacillus vulcanalis]|uniref:Dolichyl-phosphate-mannose-protein mannosyltransferase n=1 Tax=Alicyclobacillus vulcanalis TaxID=252246 RepID=A0A1N7KTS2_9BACL|nr:glycosyltransferase family 39 protein [Alicyclobacillus vulcanalis]SIS65013.1 Dolichyl-phosphate-mannose-protein mannosyltransferase [Alicyclobacillus vulcanalis]